MLRFMLCAALAFAATSASAQYADAYMQGRLTSYEVYDGSQWVDALGAAGDPGLSIHVRYYNPPNIPAPCGPVADQCGSYATEGSGPVTYGVLSTLGGFTHAPGANTCYPLGCSPLFPWSVQRGGIDTLSFSEHAITFTNPTEFTLNTLYETLFYSLAGDFLDPIEPLTIYGALSQLNATVTGTGHFFSEFRGSRDVLQEGSYRGTFEITSAYVPTPGTLALLGVGALLIGLRRHRINGR